MDLNNFLSFNRCKICNQKYSENNFKKLSCNKCINYFREITSLSENNNCNNECNNGNKCKITYLSRKKCRCCFIEKCCKNDIKLKLMLVIRNKTLNKATNQFSSQFLETMLKNSIFQLHQQKHSKDPKFKGKPWQLNEIKLIYHAQKIIEIFVVLPHNNSSKLVTNISQLFNYVHECAEDLTKYCKCLNAFKVLNLKDQLTLLKSFNTIFHVIMISFAYNPQNDSFPVIQNALKNNQKGELYHVNMSLYSLYERDNIAQVFRSYYYSLHLEMENDKCIRDLLVAQQLFKTESNLFNPELVVYQFNKYGYLLQKYLEFKYKNKSEAHFKYKSLMTLLNQIDMISFYITIILQNVDQKSIADLTKEVYIQK